MPVKKPALVGLPSGKSILHWPQPQWSSQPKSEQTKRHTQDVKRLSRFMMKRSGCPKKYWSFAVQSAVEYVNHSAHKATSNQVSPMTLHYGDAVDLSVFLFSLWQEIKYLEPIAFFLNEHMLPGRWIGIARSVGDAFTYPIVPEREDKRHRDCLQCNPKQGTST